VKIRTQFYILLSGIILIPLIVLGAMELINYYRSPERYSIPGIANFKEEHKKKKFSFEAHGEEMRRIKNFVSRLPPSVEVVIMDGARQVLYSGFGEVTEGEHLSSTRMFEIFSNGESRYFFQIDYNFGRFFDNADTPLAGRENLKGLVMISRVQHDVRPPPGRFEELFRAVVIVFVALFFFCAIVITFIARSVARSVTSLEKATRRIAEGNFDTAIAVKGSNEITSLAHSLNTMRQALKESQIRRSRFIMGVSHDLRTPLALIKGYSEAIADDVADSPQMRQKSLEIIGDKIETLEELIDDLINYVKLDSGEWRGSLVQRAIAPFLKNYATRLCVDGALLGRTVEWRVDIPDDMLVPLDERLFTRLLENLCGNALRYTAEGGIVRLEADFLPQDLLITIVVRDNGCGISEDDLPFIFDPFFRGSNSRREDGKGLGLAVVKNIADSHGWKISVVSQKDKGSAFTITIDAPKN
jgi:signal transduction histidine kinase